MATVEMSAPHARPVGASVGGPQKLVGRLGPWQLVKLLGEGELTTKLTLTVYSATASARAAVEKAGGSLTTTKVEAKAEEA